LFATLNAPSGEVYGLSQARHRHQEWPKFLRLLDQTMPAHLALALDRRQLRYSQTLQGPTLAGAAPGGFICTFTPTNASLLNMMERFFRDLTQNRQRRGVFRDLEELIMLIGTYVVTHDTSSTASRHECWQFSSITIFRSGQLCTRGYWPAADHRLCLGGLASTCSLECQVRRHSQEGNRRSYQSADTLSRNVARNFAPRYVILQCVGHGSLGHY
jgi:hypothetical protein